MSVLLDTHLWLWWSVGDPTLDADHYKGLDRLAAKNALFISAISLWEAEMLVAKKRIVLNEPFDRWLRKVSSPDYIQVLPLDAEVAIAIHELPARFHGDPADRLIVATAQVHKLAFATFDKGIRKSRLVQLWKP